MRTFRGYASRASAGILADDPHSADYSRTDQQDGPTAGRPLAAPRLAGSLSAGSPDRPGSPGCASCQDSLQGWDEEDLSPALPPAGRPGLAARLGEALLPRLSFKALALALAVNAALVLGFAKLVEEDILRLPKPVFWISLEGPAPAAPAAGTVQDDADAAGTVAEGTLKDGTAADPGPAAKAPAARAGAFAGRAAGRLAGRTADSQAR
ncbi:MAG: hypothetical protein J5863_04135 [Desulfovibrio sp.]|nr:hypothetical protein [Desulfovibrio sp.]